MPALIDPFCLPTIELDIGVVPCIMLKHFASTSPEKKATKKLKIELGFTTGLLGSKERTILIKLLFKLSPALRVNAYTARNKCWQP